MVLSNEDELKQKIQDGYIVESREESDPTGFFTASLTEYTLLGGESS